MAGTDRSQKTDDTYIVWWDKYWTDKDSPSFLMYDNIATLYRKHIIKPNLNSWLSRTCADDATVLHAGCGSGEVDIPFTNQISIDISEKALIKYKGNHTDVDVVQCDLKQLPFKEGAFDYIYNLGVMEHFYEDELYTILGEFNRIMNVDGTILLMWAPRKGGTVYFFRGAHFILNKVCDKGMWFHPPEPSLIKSKEWIAKVAKCKGLIVTEYVFELQDIFTYVKVLLKKEAT